MEEWTGFPDRPDLELIDHEEEYIDEDRYTTVTVETVNVSRDGLEKPIMHTEEENEAGEVAAETTDANQAKQARPKKVKKPKFRYESKFDRQITDRKQKARHKAKRPT